MVFGAGASARIYLSSADWMPRNFHRRVEVMFPIEAPELKQRILNEIVPAYLRDNTRARRLRADGVYEKPQPTAGQMPHRCQEELLALRPGFTAPDVPVGLNGDGADHAKATAASTGA